MYTAGDLHFAIWDFVVDEVQNMIDTEVLTYNDIKYDDLCSIKEDAVKQLDISDRERAFISMHANCVLCACEHTCELCPMYKEFGTTCTRSKAPYFIIDDCINRASLLDTEQDNEERKSLLKEAHELACRIRDMPMPVTYAEPLYIPEIPEDGGK